MQTVTLTYEVKITRGTETDRSVFTRTLSPSECYITTVEASVSGVTVPISHVGAASALILGNRDDTNLVTARLTRALRSFPQPGGELRTYSSSGGVPFARIRTTTTETLAVGDYRDMFWEPGMQLRLEGTANRDDDGPHGVAELTTNTVREDYQLNLYRTDLFSFGRDEALDHTIHQQVPQDLFVPPQTQQVADNIWTGDELVLTSDVGTPVVDVIVVGA